MAEGGERPKKTGPAAADSQDPIEVAAVRRNHGGFEAASRDDCLALWAALPEAVRRRYLEELQRGR